MKNYSLVIGGTKGIGSVISSQLKKRGDIVYTLSRSSRRINNLNIDLSMDSGVVQDQLTKFISEKNIKFNNLIFSQRFRGKNHLEEFNVTLHSSKYLIECLLSKKAIKNSIVFISSISTKTILDDQGLDYHTSRSSIVQMTKFYAVKLGSLGIRCNCILPTKIIKPENKKFYNKKNNKITKMMKQITPLSRMGDSNDVAHLVDFLTSNKSSFITGVSIPLDGGTRLQSHETIANIFNTQK